MTSEGKRIRQGDVGFHRGRPAGVPAIRVRIRSVPGQIYCPLEPAVAEGQERWLRFNCTCGPHAVSYCGFAGTDPDFAGMGAEQFTYRLTLERIVEFGCVP